MTNYIRIKKMLYVVSLASIAIVLGLMEIPWFIPSGPFAGFLKLDFSEVIILMSVLILGPKETIGVILLRSFTRRVAFGFSEFDIIGEIIAIFASLSIVLAYILSKRITGNKERPLIYEVSINNNHVSRKEWVVTTGLVILTLSLAMIIINYFITTPAYLSLMGVSQSGWWIFSFHPTVFSFVPDAGRFALFGYDIQFTFLNFLWFVVISYTPFNITKGLLVSILFLLIKPRMKYLEL
ncbi:MAG: hypothetical protein EA375_05005 [Acholeplasmataceae bacterium]|nr:MAG: hypothetical protein EA375_05005 [Acholeplasmataceae bacterium]